MFQISAPNWILPSRQYRWNLVSPPLVDPVSAEEYLDYQRVRTAEAKPGIIQDKILSATARIEGWTKRTCVNQTWDLFIDMPPGFGGFADYSRSGLAVYIQQQPPIVLPKSPLVKVIGCYVIDDTNTETVVDPASYLVSRGRDPGRIGIQSVEWPTAGKRTFESFRARFVAGYVTPFSADGSTANLTASQHGKQIGDILQLTNRGGALPFPFAERTDYYVVLVPDYQTLQLATSPGGPAVVSEDTGDGIQFIGVLPSQIRRAILMLASEDRFGSGSTELRNAKMQKLKQGISGLPEDVEAILNDIRVIQV